jgi:hypothetical protein
MIGRLIAFGFAAYVRFTLLMIGLVMSLMGCVACHQGADFRAHAKTIDAKVVEHVASDSDASGRLFATVAEFKLSDQVYRTQPSHWTTAKRLAIGDTVKVQYDERNPGVNRFDQPDELKVGAVLLPLGLIVAAGAIFGRFGPARC